MATPTVKSTYSLDLETLKRLEGLARRWGVTKSEALRRAIGFAASLPDPKEALKTLDQLQESMKMNAARARKWSEALRSERRASSHRRESGVR